MATLHLVTAYLFSDSKTVPEKGGAISIGFVGSAPGVSPVHFQGTSRRLRARFLYRSLRYDIRPNDAGRPRQLRPRQKPLDHPLLLQTRAEVERRNAHHQRGRRRHLRALFGNQRQQDLQAALAKKRPSKTTGKPSSSKPRIPTSTFGRSPSRSSASDGEKIRAEISPWTPTPCIPVRSSSTTAFLETGKTGERISVSSNPERVDPPFRFEVRIPLLRGRRIPRRPSRRRSRGALIHAPRGGRLHHYVVQ